MLSWFAREYGGVHVKEVFDTVAEEDPAAYPEAAENVYVILCDNCEDALVISNGVDTPILAVLTVIVLAGMAAVKLTVLDPTSAFPLKVVTMMLPDPDVLSVATY